MMDFYTQKNVKAKKTHECEFCGRKIIPGETYSYGCGKFDGEFFVRKLCDKCYNMLTEFINQAGEEEFQWDWIQQWLHEEYCLDECKETCKNGFSKVQCCPLIRKKFKKSLGKNKYE